MAGENQVFALVTTARNEGPYFLEWVAWHRLLGFGPIIVYQNDSDDHTEEILTCLQDIGAIRYEYNQASPGRHQVSAYKRAARLPEYLGADWCMALDMDEFLMVNTGAGRLPDLIAALPETDRVHVNWRRFGHCGHETPSAALVTERFVTAQECLAISGHLEAFKTLFRNDAFTRPGIHQPRGPKRPEETLRSTNGSGLEGDEFFVKNFRCTDPAGYALAQVNHYITRDVGSFLLKSWRGSAHQADRTIRQKYWQRGNANQTLDLRLADRAPDIWAEMQRLDRLSGGRLLTLRDMALAAHRARLAEISDQRAYRFLREFCLEQDAGLDPAIAAAMRAMRSVTEARGAGNVVPLRRRRVA